MSPPSGTSLPLPPTPSHTSIVTENSIEIYTLPLHYLSSCPQANCSKYYQLFLQNIDSQILAHIRVPSRTVSHTLGFPGGSVVKNAPAMQELRFDPWVEKIPWRRKWQPTPVFLPGESHGQRSLAGPCSHKESDMSEGPNNRIHYHVSNR